LELKTDNRKREDIWLERRRLNGERDEGGKEGEGKEKAQRNATKGGTISIATKAQPLSAILGTPPIVPLRQLSDS